MKHLLTITCAVLAVLWAAGKAQAQPFTHGYPTDLAGATTSDVTDVIIHCKITIPSDNLPFVLVGAGVKIRNNEATPDAAPPFKGALYSVDGTTVLDSTEEIGVTWGGMTITPLNFTEHYMIETAGDYNLVFWADTLETDPVAIEMDTTTYDTTWLMLSQPYGGAWPTLADNNSQANKHIIGYIVGIKGDAAIMGMLQTEDTKITSGATADKNFGSATTTNVAANNASLFRCLNVEANIGTDKAIDACTLWVYPTGITGGNADCFGVFKSQWNEGTGGTLGTDFADAAFGEGVATWNDWSNDDEEWGIAGCDSADNGAMNNIGDSTGADRTATAFSTVTLAANTWAGFDVQNGIWASIDSGGVVIKPSSGSSVSLSLNCSEATSKWPVWQFYTSDASSTQKPVIGSNKEWFGFVNDGAGTANMENYVIYDSVHTDDYWGTLVLDSITARLYQTNTYKNTRMALYNAAGTTLLDSTAQFTVPALGASAWVSQPVIQNVTLDTMTGYILCAWTASGGGGGSIKYTTTGLRVWEFGLMSRTYSGNTWPASLSRTAGAQDYLNIYAVATVTPVDGIWTFGGDTTGYWDQGCANQIVFDTVYTSVSGGSVDLDSITAHLNSVGSNPYRMALYNAAGTTLLDSTAEFSHSGTSWNGRAALLGASLAAQTPYLLAVWSQGSTNVKYRYAPGVSSTWTMARTYTGNGWPASLTFGTRGADYLLSVYGTVTTTTSAPGAGQVIIISKMEESCAPYSQLQSPPSWDAAQPQPIRGNTSQR